MLTSLHVKNLALIDETECDFDDGLHILTGETGAGKSILIGSVNLALGAKADKDLIRTGAEYALVELVFQVNDEEVIQKMKDMDISATEDGTIIISRKIQPSKSISKINGETVTTKQVKEIAEYLIDIHGQHEHQSLLHSKKHMEILDFYAGKELENVKQKIKETYHEYRDLKDNLDKSTMDEETRKKTLGLAEFEVGEIEEAGLKIGEDEELENKYRKMTNSQKILEGMSASHRLCGYEQEDGAGASIGRALRELRAVAMYDEEIEELGNQLQEIDNLLNDYNRSVADYLNDAEMDGEDFAYTQERLNLINHLKEKYGNTIELILEYEKKQQEVLDKLNDYEQYIQDLKEKMNNKRAELEKLCEQASTIRKKCAAELAAQMKKALEDLNFLSVQFEIEVRKKNEISSDGYDEAEFMISTNPGEAIRPLGQVASGGELSRVMLAIKTVLAERDSIDTLIFDEIDAGISGKTAWKVSKQLGILSRSHQVICITHLPQIAAMADVHFKIEKVSDGVSTVTNLCRLQEEESTKELARLLGGEEITDAVLLNAKEMKEMALNTKNSINNKTILY